MGEIAFSQLTSISEYDSNIQERFNFQGKIKLILLGFPMAHFPVQGF